MTLGPVRLLSDVHMIIRRITSEVGHARLQSCTRDHVQISALLISKWRKSLRRPNFMAKRITHPTARLDDSHTPDYVASSLASECNLLSTGPDALC